MKVCYQRLKVPSFFPFPTGKSSMIRIRLLYVHKCRHFLLAQLFLYVRGTLSDTISICLGEEGYKSFRVERNNGQRNKEEIVIDLGV